MSNMFLISLSNQQIFPTVLVCNNLLLALNLLLFFFPKKIKSFPVTYPNMAPFYAYSILLNVTILIIIKEINTKAL
jgi:hypothetical protein